MLQRSSGLLIKQKETLNLHQIRQECTITRKARKVLASLRFFQSLRLVKAAEPSGKRPKAERSSTARRGKSNHRMFLARRPVLSSPHPCRGGAGGGVSYNRSNSFVVDVVSVVFNSESFTPPPTPPLRGVGRGAAHSSPA